MSIKNSNEPVRRRSKVKPPGLAELMEVVREYNRARELELQTMRGIATNGYKNPMMDALYEAATAAARQMAVLLKGQS